MNALVRKELRQILPVLLLLTSIATVAWFLLVHPGEMLAPHSEDAESLLLLIHLLALVEGLVIGFGQFAVEGWTATRDYLVHRATGSRRAFHAKVLAALIGLSVLIALPPTAFGAYHLGRWDHAGWASVLRLVQAGLAGSTVFIAYALGTLVALLDRPWWVRLAFAALGAIHLLGFSTLGAVIRTDLDPVYGLLLSQAVGTVVLLWAARDLFHGQSAPASAGSRPRAFARAAILVGLALPIFAIAPAWLLQESRVGYLARLPHLVEDEHGTLYVATETDERRERSEPDKANLVRSIFDSWWPLYDLVDENGQRVPEEEASEYVPRASYRRGRFSTVYMPDIDAFTPLEGLDVQDAASADTVPFLLTGPWHRQDGDRGPHWLDLGTGTLWLRSWEERGSWEEGALRWTPMSPLPTPLREFRSPLPSGREDSLFVNPARGRFWTLAEREQTREVSLEEVTFPPGDTFVGFEPLFDAYGACAGLDDGGYGELARGSVDSYAWTGTGWKAWSELSAEERGDFLREPEFRARRAWILTLSEFDGIGFQLDVHDAKTGELRASLDLSPSTPAQRRAARICVAYGLALPPVVALASWASPARLDLDPRIRRIGVTQMDLLRGQRRTWIVAVLVVLGALLARDLWRRLERGGAGLELRLWWCAVTALFGLPAYLLCRLLEPRAARAPRPCEPREQREPRYVIRTA